MVGKLKNACLFNCVINLSYFIFTKLRINIRDVRKVSYTLGWTLFNVKYPLIP